MTLRYIEGFDYLPTSSDVSAIMRKLGWYGGGQCQISAEARYGGKGFNLYSGASNSSNMTCVLDGDGMDKGYWGGAVRWDSSNQVVAFINAESTSSTSLAPGTLFSVELSLLGQVKVYNGYVGVTGSVVKATSGGKTLVSGNWAYLEIAWDFTTNTVEVRVNTITVIYLTGVPFYNVGVPNNWSAPTLEMNAYALGYTVSLGATYWDDIYICDAEGSQNNTFLGNVRAQWLPLFSNYSTQWTSYNGSVANFTAASNQAVNDTSYVKNRMTDTGNKDLYNVTPMVNTPVIYGLAVKGAYRQDDATQGFVKNTLTSGATSVDGASFATYSTYTFNIDIWETDPNTGSGWLYSAINSIKIGPKQA